MKQRSRGRRWLFWLVIAAAIAAGWYFRNFLGLRLPTVPPPPVPSASAPADARVVPAPPCVLRLDSRGLFIDDQPASISAAVTACGRAGKARLRTTGGARAGTYDDLIEALDAADIVIERN